MVMPAGSGDAPALSIAPDDLRQLAEHDAVACSFSGGTGPLAALDTGGGDRGTVLLVAGYTGSKEDFAPLLRPACEAGYRLVAVDQTDGSVLWRTPAIGLPTGPVDLAGGGTALPVPEAGAVVLRDPATGAELGRSAVPRLYGGWLVAGVGPVLVAQLPDRVVGYR